MREWEADFTNLSGSASNLSDWKDSPVTKTYVHQALNQDVTAIGGSYELIREERLPFEERMVLYVVGHGMYDACCGVGGCAFALVPGFIVRWKHEVKDGLPVSEVESIAEESDRQALRQQIMGWEAVTQVNFL
jgi:hypothetical protein